jgi:hypothetical protein
MMHFDPTYAAAASGGMSDLTKILVAGAVGLFTGLAGSVAGEPLKQALVAHLKRNDFSMRCPRRCRGHNDRHRHEHFRPTAPNQLWNLDLWPTS